MIANTTVSKLLLLKMTKSTASSPSFRKIPNHRSTCVFILYIFFKLQYIIGTLGYIYDYILILSCIHYSVHEQAITSGKSPSFQLIVQK